MGKYMYLQKNTAKSNIALDFIHAPVRRKWRNLMPNSILPHHENFNRELVEKSAEKIREWLVGWKKPTIALTLGSGLGGFGKGMPGAKERSYHDLCLPTGHVPGHAGVLRYVPIGGVYVLVFDGRAHFYEGNDFQAIVRGVRAATMFGVKTHIITCASGGINSIDPGLKE